MTKSDSHPNEKTPFVLPTRPETWYEERSAAGDIRFGLRIDRHVASQQSRFQRVDIYDTEAFGRIMTIDGLMMLTERDEFVYHDMMAHVPLFSHPNPRNVLIIGGGDGGTLREVLKHPTVERATLIEIDHVVVDMAREHLPNLAHGMDDPRADVRIDDGIEHVKNAASEHYDVILVDSTDPVGPAEGLFTAPFYQDCYRVLAADGVLCQQTESPLYSPNLIQMVTQALRAVGFTFVRTAQAHCVSYPSGWWTFTLGSKGLDPAHEFRESDAKARPFATRYYNEQLHRGGFLLPTFLRELVDG